LKTADVLKTELRGAQKGLSAEFIELLVKCLV